VPVDETRASATLETFSTVAANGEVDRILAADIVESVTCTLLAAHTTATVLRCCVCLRVSCTHVCQRREGGMVWYGMVWYTRV